MSRHKNQGESWDEGKKGQIEPVPSGSSLCTFYAAFCAEIVSSLKVTSFQICRFAASISGYQKNNGKPEVLDDHLSVKINH